MKLVSIGYGNVINGDRSVAVLGSTGASVKRLRDDARDRGQLVDATQGRKMRSVIVTDSDHVILSAVHAETISGRLIESEELE